MMTWKEGKGYGEGEYDLGLRDGVQCSCFEVESKTHGCIESKSPSRFLSILRFSGLMSL